MDFFPKLDTAESAVENVSGEFNSSTSSNNPIVNPNVSTLEKKDNSVGDSENTDTLKNVNIQHTQTPVHSNELSQEALEISTHTYPRSDNTIP